MRLYSIYTLFSSHRRAPRLVAEARAQDVVHLGGLARRGREAHVGAVRALEDGRRVGELLAGDRAAVPRMSGKLAGCASPGGAVGGQLLGLSPDPAQMLWLCAPDGAKSL